MSLLRMLHEKFGGTPRFLLQIKEALKEMDAAELEKELKNITLPSDVKSSELQKLKDKYFADIFAERLFGYFSPESQKALCRSAVYGVPVTLDGLKAVSLELSEDVSDFVQGWQDRAFVYRETDKSRVRLWVVYGLLRGWLLAKLSIEELKQAYKAAGNFLFKMVEQERLHELDLSLIDCLLETRFQYLNAGMLDMARKVTDRLSGSLEIYGLYDIIRKLNMELPDHERYPAPMRWIGRAFLEQGDYVSAGVWYQRHKDAATGSDVVEEAMALYGLAAIDLKKGDYESARNNLEKSMKIVQRIGDRAGEAAIWRALASIDMRKGEYEAARDKFEKSMKIVQPIFNRNSEAAIWHQLALIDLSEVDYDAARDKLEKSMGIVQQIGYRPGEAAILHNLATIDLIEGDDDAAREKFDKSLKIVQQIGNLEGEGAVFCQLGLLALKQGKDMNALRLISISYLILSNIDHSDAKKCFRYLCETASKIGLSHEQLSDLLKEVSKSHRHDRGRSLIDATFR